MVAYQCAVNLDQAPTTGIPLPFVVIGDPGGAALWARLGANQATAWTLSNGAWDEIEMISGVSELI